MRIPSFLSRLAACAAVVALALSCSDPAAPGGRAPLSAASRTRTVAPSLAPGAPAGEIRTRLTTGMCLDVYGGVREAGGYTIIWNCYGGDNQQWSVPAVGAAGEIRVYGAMCLDAFGGAGNDGDTIGIWDCNGRPHQQWTVTASGELRGINGKCVDVTGSAAVPGTRVILWSCHGGPNQQWDVPQDAPATFVGAGDIAGCTWTGDEETAALLDTIPGVVWAAGDLAYPNGTADEFANCYGPSWGRLKARTRPAPGNHEYNTPGATPYYAYFGDAAGPAGRGYYSYDVGRWHVVTLNSNVDVSAASAQAAWLRADLAANPRACTLAYWHHPRFSSAGSSTKYQALWQVLYDAGADVVLVGHLHNYERFAPQTPAGAADPARGIREFVVGTGGAGLTRVVPSILPNSEFLDGSHHGVLKLELGAASYRWAFVSTDGAVRDSGQTSCH